MSLVRTILMTLLALSCLGSWAAAARIELRTECVCSGTVVALGDVADVTSADADEAAKLAGIELCPAPTQGRPRFLGQREVQDLLLLAGENLARHQFSGASQTAIRRGDGSKSSGPDRPLSEAVGRRANRQLRETIVEHLNRVASGEPWSVAVELTSEQARLVAGVGHAVAIRGGQSPWVGRQQFEVLVTPPGGAAISFSIAADVSLPEAVVVSTRALPRGALLNAAELRLVRVEGPLAIEGAFHTIEEVVGKEAIRAIPAEQPMTADWVRSPLLVRRGEIVSVTAQSTGIRLTTNARSREDGSLGDLIRVESLEDRTAYFARVCGLRSLEVFAGPVRAERSETERVGMNRAGANRLGANRGRHSTMAAGKPAR